MNIPKKYTSEYYLDKFPLYIKNRKERSLYNIFSNVELYYLELQKLLESNSKTLHEIVYEDRSEESLYSPIIHSSFEQNKLYVEFNKRLSNTTDSNFKPIKSLFYYQFLVHQLQTSSIQQKQAWRGLLYSLDLVDKIKLKPIIQNNSVSRLKVIIDSLVDPLIIWIFEELIVNRIYIFKEVEIVEGLTKDIESFRLLFQEPRFDKTKFGDNTFYRHSNNPIKIKFNKGYENEK